MNLETLHEASRNDGLPAAESRLSERWPPVDEIAIWCVALDQQPPPAAERLKALLSRDEMERAGRFHFERDRRRFQIGRGVLRTLLGGYLGVAPQDVCFAYNENGKPSVPNQAGTAPAARPATLHFNLAHSETLAVIAFSAAGPVGIDLELMREIPEWEQLAERWFLPAEVARLAGTRPELRRAEFFRLWTRTEAALKASGVGLGGLGPGQSPFEVYALKLDTRFAAAIAASPPAQWATLRMWQDERWLPQRQPVTRRMRLADLASGKIDLL